MGSLQYMHIYIYIDIIFIYGGLMFEVVGFGFGGTSLTPLAPVLSGVHFFHSKIGQPQAGPMLGLAWLYTSLVGCPFPKAPTCFKIAVALFQMLEVHMQHLPVGTPLLAKFFPEIPGF